MAHVKAAPTGSGTGSCDCEEEDQDESSSSHSDQNVDPNTLSQGEVNKTQNDVDELSVFRQQWQRELQSTLSPHKEAIKPVQEQTNSEEQTDEEKAKSLFLRGIEMERSGKLYEAIQHYKRAIQILPDVERRLYEGDLKADTPEEELEIEEECNDNVAEDSEDEDVVEGEELLSRLQRILAKKGHLCEMKIPTQGCHISWLPYEVVQLILRWVVSADLDAASLERVAAVSRGFYVAARDNDIWKALCLRTWGVECGSPRAGGWGSWRHMFVERPRLALHGCYISKASYLRHGENSFQDQSYRPWYLVDYYRYLRFFPEGLVLMWTTADEPASCVAQLRYRSAKPSLGIMSGHYRLVGDKVVIIIKKTNTEKRSAQPSHSRFRARRRDAPEHAEQTFHMELELRAWRGRRGAGGGGGAGGALVWRHYAVAARGAWTAFDLAPAKFPPFAFSRVRSYTAEALEPLSAR